MKSLVWLSELTLLNCGVVCGVDASLDIRTVKARSELEGESFLTITLPALCSAFDRALSSGTLERRGTEAFKWHRAGLPQFLRGFLLKVFASNGKLLPEPDFDAVRSVRQILLMFKKLKRDCAPKRLSAAERGFVECENEVRSHTVPRAHILCFEAVARVIWSDILASVPFGDPRENLVPKHGPGATAERVHGNAKYLSNKWHRRLEQHFPFTEYRVESVVGGLDANEGDADFVEPSDEPPVRVVFVPKTQKTPRVIAIEPVCMQYVQQALLLDLVPRIEGARFTRGNVNFTDQSINQRLALTSSVDGRYASIDMKEASDRVSLDLVTRMLSVAPVYRDLVMACRSSSALLPSGEIIPLSKFASMGSALCFPMEAIAFYCAIAASRLMRAKRTVTARSVYFYTRDVRVYGDDIFVPTDEAPAICVDLELFGFKVNSQKSFWEGNFRESCGTDAFRGMDVTPTYMREEIPADRRDAEAIVSFAAMANHLYMKGFWLLARECRSHLEDVMGPLPHVRPDSQGLGWYSYSKEATFRRWNARLMRLEERAYVLHKPRASDPIDGEPALLKCLLMLVRRIESDSLSHLNPTPVEEDHLTHSVARGGPALRSRWISA